MKISAIVRHFQLAGVAHWIGVRHHRVTAATNRRKIWQRYAGCLVLEGRGSYHDWQGREHAVQPGCFVHHLPGRHHHIERIAGGWRECVLILGTDDCRRWVDAGVIDERWPVLDAGGAQPFQHRFDALSRSLLSEDESRWQAAMLEAGALLLHLQQAASERRQQLDGVLALEQARARLAADHAALLSLESLAVGCGLSYVAFRRHFKQRFGMSPGAYRNRQRFEQAALVLAHQTIAISELAEHLGYADQFVFSRRFKQHHGCAPSVYHRRHYQE